MQHYHLAGMFRIIADRESICTIPYVYLARRRSFNCGVHFRGRVLDLFRPSANASTIITDSCFVLCLMRVATVFFMGVDISMFESTETSAISPSTNRGSRHEFWSLNLLGVRWLGVTRIESRGLKCGTGIRTL